MKCICGLELSGELYNLETFMLTDCRSGVTCPHCGRTYINGVEILVGKCTCGAKLDDLEVINQRTCSNCELNACQHLITIFKKTMLCRKCAEKKRLI